MRDTFELARVTHVKVCNVGPSTTKRYDHKRISRGGGIHCGRLSSRRNYRRGDCCRFSSRGNCCRKLSSRGIVVYITDIGGLVGQRVKIAPMTSSGVVSYSSRHIHPQKSKHSLRLLGQQLE